MNPQSPDPQHGEPQHGEIQHGEIHRPMTGEETIMPTASSPVCGKVIVPGSKSMTNRALVLAAISSTPSVIEGALISRDTKLMISALRSLGITVEQDPTCPTTLRVDPGACHDGDIHCGLAGTVMRFTPPLVAALGVRARFDGDPEAYRRPMSTMVDALLCLGVTVQGDRLPFVVDARSWHSQSREHTGAAPDAARDFSTAAAHDKSGDAATGVCVTIDASSSSQFVSGLLLAGCRFPGGLTVIHSGADLPSRPHIEMTLSMLEDAGITVVTGPGDRWHVAPGFPPGRRWVMEPDLSNAAAYLAAAAVTGGSVTIPRWPQRTTQAGDFFRTICQDMGCEATYDQVSGELTITGPPPGELVGIDVDLSAVGELTPTIAALAAVASTPSRLRGISHLRGHETDRLAALAEELTRVGAHTVADADGLSITPATGGICGGVWCSHADHRMATAGAIVALAASEENPIIVDDLATTAKTLPSFAADWSALVGPPPQRSSFLPPAVEDATANTDARGK